jgi:hypothetical protein
VGKAILSMYLMELVHLIVLSSGANYEPIQGLLATQACIRLPVSCLQACSKYEAALQLRPVSHSALYNWGVALSDLARLTRPTDPVTARYVYRRPNVSMRGGWGLWGQAANMAVKTGYHAMAMGTCSS